MEILKLIGIIIGTHCAYILCRALFFSRSEVFGEEWNDNLLQRLVKRAGLWLLIFAGLFSFYFGDTSGFVNEFNRKAKEDSYTSSNTTTSPNESSVPQQQNEKSYDASSFEKELEELK